MSRHSTRYLVLLVGLLMLVSIVNVADKELLAPVADAVRTDLGMNDTELGAVLSGNGDQIHGSSLGWRYATGSDW